MITIENVDYHGKVVNELFREAVSEQVFTTEFGIDVKKGYKSKYTVFDVSATAEIYAYQKVPIRSSNATAEQRTKDLCEFRCSGDMDHNSFIATFLESEYAEGFNNEKITQLQVYQVIRDLFLAKIQVGMSLIGLYGNVAEGSGIETLCDGLLAEFADRSGNNTLDGDLSLIQNTDPEASSTTYGDQSYQDNVYGQMLRIVNALPARLRYRNTKRGKPVLGIDPVTMELYKQWLVRAQTLGGGGLNPSAPAPKYFDEYELKVLVDLKPGEMIFTDPKNIMWVTDDQNDAAYFSVIDNFKINQQKELIWDVAWRSKCDVKRADEMVYYQTT